MCQPPCRSRPSWTLRLNAFFSQVGVCSVNDGSSTSTATTEIRASQKVRHFMLRSMWRLSGARPRSGGLGLGLAAATLELGDVDLGVDVAAQDPDADLLLDLDGQELVGGSGDLAHQPAASDHVLTLLQGGEHGGVLLLLLDLRTDQDEVEDREHQKHHDERTGCHDTTPCAANGAKRRAGLASAEAP